MQDCGRAKKPIPHGMWMRVLSTVQLNSGSVTGRKLCNLVKSLKTQLNRTLNRGDGHVFISGVYKPLRNFTSRLYSSFLFNAATFGISKSI